MKVINSRRSLFLVLILLLIGALIYRHTLVIVTKHSIDTWSASRRLSRALDGARSVVFVEFEDNTDKIHVAAKPEEIARLRRATSGWLIPSRPDGALCFIPHHRVDVLKADGSLFQFVICFECRNFLIEDAPWRNAYSLPDHWRKSLIILFKSVGMSPWNADEHGVATEMPR